MNLDIGQTPARPPCACYTHRMQATLLSIVSILVVASVATTTSLWRDQLALCVGLVVLIAVLSALASVLSLSATIWSCILCKRRPGSPACVGSDDRTYSGYRATGDNPLTETREASDSRPLVPIGNLHEDGSMGAKSVCCPMCKCRGESCTGVLGRIFFWFAFALFIISVLGTFALAGITVDLFATTLPNKKATLHLEGLHGDVTIHREDSGMFHIAATSMHDAAFGQGVAHAQDRLWQMEFQRRVGRGTLSAAVGKGGLKFDKFMRTLGVYKAAQAAVPLIDTDPTTAELLDGYIAGVNAYIDTKPYLPLEMKVLGIQPEPFTRADSIVWAKIMSYDLSENWKRETLRHQLLVGRGLTPERIEQLMPFFQVDRFPTVLENEDLPPSQRNMSAVQNSTVDISPDVAVAQQLLALARERKAAATSRQLLRERAADDAAATNDGLVDMVSRALRKTTVPAGSGCDTQKQSGLLARIMSPSARNSLAFVGAYAWSYLSGDVSALASHLIPDKELTPAGSLFAGASPDGGPSIGSQASNNWVVGGNRTATGKPLMANDPHLMLSAPSIWIVNHLHVSGPNPTGDPTWDAIGSSFPLLPGIVLGHNNHVSWAVTNTGADVQDLFVMNDTASDGSAYWYKGAWVPYNLTQEVIQVKGGKDVTITVRGTVFGNVVTDNDVTNATMSAGATMALRWVSTDPTIQDTTLLAFMQMSVSKNYTEWRNALKHYVAPSQNFIFADTQGNISYQMPGWIPHRDAAHSGAYPVPGNGDAAYEWKGRVPFDALPRTLNPPKGYIVTANNKVTPSQYTKYNLTPYNRGWNSLSVGYRAKRITDMVLQHSANGSLITMQDMRTMQGDYRSYLADDVMAGVLLADRSALSSGARAVFDKLAGWDRVMSVGGEVPVLFAYLVSELTVLGTAETGGQQWVQFGFLYNALQSDASVGGTDPACVKLGFTTCTAFVQSALERTAQFHSTLGDEKSLDHLVNLPVTRDHWSKADRSQWGKVLHPAQFAHAILGKTPLACLANRYTQHGGDWSTVNVGAFALPSQRYMAELREGSRSKHAREERAHDKVDEEDSLQVKWATEDSTPLFMQSAGPSYRGVYDLATVGADGSAEQSVFLNPLGQSGNILSRDYDNLLEDWSNTQYLDMLTRGYDDTLTQKLKPA